MTTDTYILFCIDCFIHSGMSAGQAEYKFLDKVKWLDMYGVDLHSVLVCKLTHILIVR